MHFLTNLLSFSSVMDRLWGILLAVIVLLVMITVHEFGHYIAGRILHFKINEFSIGFGPAIFKRRSKKSGRLFALRLIPLGGYCAFDGEDGEELEEEKNPFGFEEKSEYPEPEGKRFTEQAPWKRIIVLIAGATMNYLLALLTVVVMFSCYGRPMYEVVKENPNNDTETVAVETGLQTEDIILEVNGETVYLITDYMDVLDGKKAGDTVVFTVLSDGKKVNREVVLSVDADFKNMSDTNTLLNSLGIYGLYSSQQKEGFFETIGHSFVYSFKLGGMVLRSFGELLTGKIGLGSVGGPITTVKVTADVASSGFVNLLSIIALIGVNLAVFNLLPIPALDGCKVIFCIIEWIRKKPVNRNVEAMIHFAGIIFLFGFAILVDLLQLF